MLTLLPEPSLVSVVDCVVRTSQTATGLPWSKELTRFPSQVQTYCSFTCRSSTRKIPLAERFWAKVRKDADCWAWTGQRIPTGYGQLRANRGRTQVPATHVAWFLASGAYPPRDAVVCHTCDNPSCVRADDVGTYAIDGVPYPRRGHPWLGTTHANARDRVLKGRQRGGPGTVHG